MNEVFLDTSHAIALASPADKFHRQAITVVQEINRMNARVVTTRAVMLEIGNAFASVQRRKAGLALLDSLEQDPHINILSMTEGLYSRAVTLYRNRPDKAWGLVDCVSFVVMQERRITDALTSDLHFTQAGFRALLRD